MRRTKQYAYGLLASISKEDAVIIFKELNRVVNIFRKIPEYAGMVDFKPEEFAVIREILAGEYNNIVINFLEVLAQDGMLSQLSTIIEDYRIALVQENLLYDVKVYSAAPLTVDSKNNIENLVKTRWGNDYLIDYKTNEKILGGIRLEVNGAVIDTTFRSRIDQIIREVQHGSKR